MTRGKPVLTDDRSGFSDVTRALDHRSQAEKKPISRGFVVFMAVLTLVFATLGFWQMQRLGQKEALIAASSGRIDLPPLAFPPSGEWKSLDPETLEFQPVELTGHFSPGNRVLVFTSLSEPKGRFGGPGYWVVEPFMLDGGGTVIVNRGFVPEASADIFGNGTGNGVSGTTNITGIARKSERVGAFTPGPDLTRKREYVRSIERLAAMTDPDLTPFAPVYVDMTAGPAGALPQGGETVTSFPNRHLEYALTWFSLAVLTPLLTLVWLRRQRQD